MKKEYRKPDIAFEDFALQANIASGCAKEIGGVSLFTEEADCYMYGTKFDGNSCSFVDGFFELFSEGLTGCRYTMADDMDGDGSVETLNGVCYEVPGDGQSIFAS